MNRTGKQIESQGVVLLPKSRVPLVLQTDGRSAIILRLSGLLITFSCLKLNMRYACLIDSDIETITQNWESKVQVLPLLLGK